VLNTSGKINGVCFSLLIDPGATESFISFNALSRSGMMACCQEDLDLVEMASGVKQGVGQLVKDCEVYLGVCVTQVSLYTTTLGSYDILIGMDWLEAHEAVLDCKGKVLHFIDDSEHNQILVGAKRGVLLRFISVLQLKRSIRKGCKLYAVVTMNKKDDAVDVARHPVL
jgi:hypothetical protein